MPAELFALNTAFFFALHNVLIKKGLKTSNPTTAVFTTIGINMPLLWVLGACLHPLDSLATPNNFRFLRERPSWYNFFMFRTCRIAPLAGLFFCLLAAPAYSTDLYKWKDERGVVHFSDNPHNIPEEFRENSTRIRSLAPSRSSKQRPDYGVRASIPLKKKGMTAVVPAIINDGPQADFILDTGASYTVISTSVARDANIDLDKQYPKVRLQTANGIIDAPLVNLDSIDIDGMRVTDITVAVHDFTVDDSIAGLLGLNYLSHFRMDLDAQNGILVLERK